VKRVFPPKFQRWNEGKMEFSKEFNSEWTKEDGWKKVYPTETTMGSLSLSKTVHDAMCDIAENNGKESIEGMAFHAISNGLEGVDVSYAVELSKVNSLVEDDSEIKL